MIGLGLDHLSFNNSMLVKVEVEVEVQPTWSVILDRRGEERFRDFIVFYFRSNFEWDD